MEPNKEVDNNEVRYASPPTIKRRIDVFSDGSIAILESPPGFDLEVHKSLLGKPVEQIKDVSESTVEDIKQKGSDNVIFDFKSKKIKDKPQKAKTTADATSEQVVDSPTNLP